MYLLLAFSIALPALDRDRDFAHRFFGPTGICFEAAAESQINAYSALFGSGIGYVSRMNEQLTLLDVEIVPEHLFCRCFLFLRAWLMVL